LTNELERQAMELIAKVDELGGSERAIAEGFFQEEIGRSAYEHQMRVESGENVVVGVNRFEDGKEPPPIPAPDYSALEAGQVASVQRVRSSRPAKVVEKALADLRTGAKSLLAAAPEPMMPLIISAVKARATVGEIADALGEAWGRYTPVL
jgi:methylmalonyl-CoA mutase N-terminal domain/subunit